MSDNKSNGMMLDGVFASEAIDSSGEIFSVKGADISSFSDGTGHINWEHRSHDESVMPGEEIVGKVVSAKKIYKASDCENDRQRMYWEKIKVPFIYGVARLFDGAGHEGAKAISAIIRDADANNDPVSIGWSIEGSTLTKKDNRLEETVCRRVAITIKPCNKSAYLGMMEDPNAPAGFQKKKKKKDSVDIAGQIEKFEDPKYMKLGGTVLDYSPEMRKTMTAGVAAGSPGTLTNGPALQREDLGRTIAAVAKGVFRDWDKKTPIRECLKAKLPEVDDDVLEEFAEMFEGQRLKIAKAEEVIKGLKSGAIEAPEEEEDEENVKDAAPDAPMTIRGITTAPRPGQHRPEFDSNSGILRTRRGSFPIYIPSGHELAPFMEALHNPEAEKHHGYAVEQWLKLHKMLASGQLPPEILHHAMAFSALSVNTPVPVQELMFGHLMGAMDDTGVDFLSSKRATHRLFNDWMGRDSRTEFPSITPDHWQRVRESLMVGEKPEEGVPDERPIKKFQLASQKFNRMANLYRDLHGPMFDLLTQHGKDVRTVASEIMHFKQEVERMKDRNSRMRSAGKPEDEMPDLPDFTGWAPKTIRYALGMMGGGNVVVPDTHFVRHLFGLDRGPDKDSIKHLKTVLWNPNNHDLLNQIDQYYAAHHPAVRFMLEHPQHGQHFATAEDAIFPAFWRHWMAILPHEKAIGLKTRGSNELTDHKPYFESIAGFGKSEDTWRDAKDSAVQHMEWVHQYGAVPAQMLFCTHILPKLLANAAQNKAQTLIRTFEGLSVDLNKAVSAPPPKKKKATPPVPWYEAVVNWNGQKTRVGRVYPDQTNVDRHLYPAGGMPLLGADDKYLYMVNAQMPTSNFPMEDDGTVKPWWGPNEVIKVPRHTGSISPMAGDWQVESYPQKIEGRTTIDAEKDGVGDYLHHDDIKQMVHGLDFSQKRRYAATGRQANTSFWGKLPDGTRAYFKRAPTESEFNAARKEALAYNLSRDFFKLDKYFTPTALVRSPIDGGEYAVVKGVKGKTGFEWEGDLSFGGLHSEGIEGLRAAHDAGDLHKLEMFDTIMNNADRHMRNVMFDKTGKPTLIDHGHAMSLHHTNGSHNRMRGLAREIDSLIDQHNQWAARIPGTEHIEPFDFSQTPNRTWHPEAVKWVAGLNEHEFDKHLIRHGVPHALRSHLVRRMKLLKEAATTGKDVDKSRYYVVRAGEDAKTGMIAEPVTAPGQGSTADVPVMDNPGDIASDGQPPPVFEEKKRKAKEPVRKPKRLVN